MHTIDAISESRCILAFQQTLRGHVAATNQEANKQGMSFALQRGWKISPSGVASPVRTGASEVALPDF